MRAGGREDTDPVPSRPHCPMGLSQGKIEVGTVTQFHGHHSSPLEGLTAQNPSAWAAPAALWLSVYASPGLQAGVTASV